MDLIKSLEGAYDVLTIFDVSFGRITLGYLQKYKNQILQKNVSIERMIMTI